MDVPPLIRSYRDRIDALTLRERVLTFLAGAAIVVGWAYGSLLQPVLAGRSALSNAIQQQQEEMRAWDLQIEALARSKASGTVSDKRALLVGLQKRAAELDRQIGERHSQLVPPERMGDLLADVLRRSRGLQLASLTTLPAERVGGVQDARLGQMYRHGIEVTVIGPYLNLMSYLSDLERIPTKIFWGDMQLSAEYPVVTLKISLYTLSPEKAWLAL